VKAKGSNRKNEQAKVRQDEASHID